jgi:hypothetical protein
MNTQVNDSKICVGHLNQSTYFAIETPYEKFGFKLDAQGKAHQLSENELPSAYKKKSAKKPEYHYSKPLQFDNSVMSREKGPK